MQPLPTTTLLLNRLHDSRDGDAWKQFDDRFRGVILAAALRLGLAPSDAEEAAQETIVQALRDYQAGKYDRAKGRLSSWIISIAHHRISDLKRVRKRRAASPSDNPPGEPATQDLPVADVAAAFDDALERRIFEQAWEQLRSQNTISQSTLLAFELTALRGVPPAEAAAQCGISVDQVYVARTRIARRLREIVETLDRAIRDGL